MRRIGKNFTAKSLERLMKMNSCAYQNPGLKSPYQLVRWLEGKKPSSGKSLPGLVRK
jgi:hypothetical protein